jgi:hypothetical protein
MKIYLFLFFSIFISSKAFSQEGKFSKKELLLNKTTEVNLTGQIDQIYQSIISDSVYLGKVSFQNQNCYFNFNDNKYTLVPEKYNIGINLVKDHENKIIGMTEKMDNNYILGIENRIFKFIKLLNQTNKYYLTELKEGKKETSYFSKTLFLKISKNSKMEILHDLDNIPVSILPALIRTKQTSKEIKVITTKTNIKIIFLALRLVTTITVLTIALTSK